MLASLFRRRRILQTVKLTSKVQAFGVAGDCFLRVLKIDALGNFWRQRDNIATESRHQ